MPKPTALSTLANRTKPVLVPELEIGRVYVNPKGYRRRIESIDPEVDIIHSVFLEPIPTGGKKEDLSDKKFRRWLKLNEGGYLEDLQPSGRGGKGGNQAKLSEGLSARSGAPVLERDRIYTNKSGYQRQILSIDGKTVFYALVGRIPRGPKGPSSSVKAFRHWLMSPCTNLREDCERSGEPKAKGPAKATEAIPAPVAPPIVPSAPFKVNGINYSGFLADLKRRHAAVQQVLEGLEAMGSSDYPDVIEDMRRRLDEISKALAQVTSLALADAPRQHKVSA